MLRGCSESRLATEISVSARWHQSLPDKFDWGSKAGHCIALITGTVDSFLPKLCRRLTARHVNLVGQMLHGNYDSNKFPVREVWLYPQTRKLFPDNWRMHASVCHNLYSKFPFPALPRGQSKGINHRWLDLDQTQVFMFSLLVIQTLASFFVTYTHASGTTFASLCVAKPPRVGIADWFTHVQCKESFDTPDDGPHDPPKQN